MKFKTNKTNNKAILSGPWPAIWFVACLGIQSCVAPVEMAKRRADHGNVAEAVSILHPMAEKGDSAAQYELAKIYLSGRAATKESGEGMRWLLKAAEQGNPKAQLDLGYHYAVDDKNYVDALKWYLKAGEHFDDPASLIAAENLGVLYSNGQGVKQDYAEAARWYRKSAERGGARGQFGLGLLYFDGLGVSKDFNEAVKWMGQAAKQQYRLAQYTLTFVYAEGIETKPNAVEAAYWYSGMRVSDEGQAHYLVGNFFAAGFIAWNDEIRVLAWMLRHTGVAEDLANQYLKQVYSQRWVDQDRAVQWYHAGAEAGFVGAQVNLARIQWNEKSPYWNCAEAAKWTRLAADKADPTAMVNMGIFYGQGPERTVIGIGAELQQTEKAIEVKNVRGGDPAERGGLRAEDLIVSINNEDTLKLGIRGVIDKLRASANKKVTLGIRRKGNDEVKTIIVMPDKIAIKCPGAESAGLKRDSAEAVKWFQKASDRGNLTGLFYLAKAYQEGNGVPQNYKKAMELFEQGAGRGDWEAAQAMSHMYSAGEGVEKSQALADKWFRKAIDLKHKAVGRN